MHEFLLSKGFTVKTGISFYSEDIINRRPRRVTTETRQFVLKIQRNNYEVCLNWSSIKQRKYSTNSLSTLQLYSYIKKISPKIGGIWRELKAEKPLLVRIQDEKKKKRNNVDNLTVMAV